jgi:hypothetical protein
VEGSVGAAEWLEQLIAATDRALAGLLAEDAPESRRLVADLRAFRAKRLAELRLLDEPAQPPSSIDVSGS